MRERMVGCENRNATCLSVSVAFRDFSAIDVDEGTCRNASFGAKFRFFARLMTTSAFRMGRRPSFDPHVKFFVNPRPRFKNRNCRCRNVREKRQIYQGSGFAAQETQHARGLSRDAHTTTRTTAPSSTMTSTQQASVAIRVAIPGLLNDIVTTHVFAKLPDPRDLAVLRAVSSGMRDAVDATGRKVEEFSEEMPPNADT